MIYIVNFNRIALAIIEGATIISMSSDGSKALMSNSTPLSVEFISEHPDEEKDNILSQEEWRQPCENC